MNKVWLVPLLFIALLVGCFKTSLEPIAIDVDVENCAACNMGINELAHATQVLFEDGKSDIYDDIGCMISAFKENENNRGTGFVHDYNSDEWIDMDEATYVQGSNIPTPMSYGIVAFKSLADAEAFQTDNGGDIYSFKDLTQIEMQDLKHADVHHEESSDFHD